MFDYYSNILVNGNVPKLTISLCVIALIVSVVLPFALMIIFKKKFGSKLKAFWFGALVFLVFVMIVESLINQIVLLKTGVGTKIMSNMWLYALYGGLMAGLFEECGRLVCMKYLMEDCKDDRNAGLMYGAGHGGCEVIALFSLTMVNNLVYAALINSGAIRTTISALKATGLDENTLATRLAAYSTLITGSSWTVLVGLVERLLAVTLHLAFSVLVWACVKTGKKAYFGLAFLMHFLTDAVIVLVAMVLPNFITNGDLANWLTEAVCAVFTVVTVLLAGIAYRDMKNTETAVAEISEAVEV